MKCSKSHVLYQTGTSTSQKPIVAPQLNAIDTSQNTEVKTVKV